MQFRLSVVFSLIMVLFVNSVSGNFGEFLYNLPLKITDSLASVVRLFEENFRYHTPSEKVYYKRSDLMSKIQNSFDDDVTTPGLDPVAAKYHNPYRKSNLNEYDLDKYVNDEKTKKNKKEDKSKDISNTLTDDDMAPVVPHKIPYIPQPKAGMLDFFMSRRPLVQGREYSDNANADPETDPVQLDDTKSTRSQRNPRHVPPQHSSTLHGASNIPNNTKLYLEFLAAIKEKRDPIAVMLQMIIHQPLSNKTNFVPMKLLKN